MRAAGPFSLLRQTQRKVSVFTVTIRLLALQPGRVHSSQEGRAGAQGAELLLSVPLRGTFPKPRWGISTRASLPQTLTSPALLSRLSLDALPRPSLPRHSHAGLVRPVSFPPEEA